MIGRCRRLACSFKMTVPMAATTSVASRTSKGTGLLALLAAGFALTGIPTVIIGPILPLFISRWSLSDTQAGLFFTVQFMAALCGVWISTATDIVARIPAESRHRIHDYGRGSGDAECADARVGAGGDRCVRSGLRHGCAADESFGGRSGRRGYGEPAQFRLGHRCGRLFAAHFARVAKSFLIGFSLDRGVLRVCSGGLLLFRFVSA